MKKTRSAIEIFIGARIRERRMLIGLAQQQLGEILGVTNTQIHQYEHAMSTIWAGQLYEIARALDTPIDYFFEGLDKQSVGKPQHHRMLLNMMRNFSDIQNEKLQEAINQLTRALAECSPLAP